MRRFPPFTEQSLRCKLVYSVHSAHAVGRLLWGGGVMSWLPFSSAESVFDNVIISTMHALYLCQEQAVLGKKNTRFSEKTHADNDIMTQHKAGFCLSRSVYV